MKGHRFQLAALLLAVVSIGAYGMLPASASGPAPNAPAHVNVFSVATNAIVATWPPATVPTGGSAVTSYTLTPTPACGGCTGLTTSGATSTRVVGLTNGTPYTFTVHASNGTAGPESPSSASVTPHANGSSCQFDAFPAVPGGSSEFAVACTLSTDIGGAGNHYNVEDFPQAKWHSGAGRVVTTTAATAATSAVITASAGHFTTNDINDTISGTGIPSNVFIKSVTATTATLNKVVGSPGVANGAKLTVDNSDGRTFTDALSPATTVTGGSTTTTAVTTHVTTALASIPASFTLSVTANSTTNFPATGTVPSSGALTIVTNTPAGTIKATYTGKTASSFTGVHKVSGTGTKIASGAAVTLSVAATNVARLQVASTTSLSAAGDVTVPTTSPTGTAVLAYTGGGGGGTVLTGVTVVSGSGTIATAAAVKQAVDISAVTTLNVVSTTGFSASGQATVKTTSAALATISYTGGGGGGTSLTGVTLDSGSGFVSTSGAVSSINSIVVNSATGHFCTTGITGCLISGATWKNDVGRGIGGTRIPHGTTIASVVSATQITLSTATIACPTGVTTCGQFSINSPTTLTTAREIQDATFMTSPSRVCSATALFGQTDVNLPISSAGTPAILGTTNYITGIATGCPGGTTGVNLHAAVIAGTNTKVVIGSPNGSAPKNGDAVMSLSSMLSVSPTLAAGEPDCSFNTAVGSNLQGKWLNPGSFDSASLGALPNTGVTGPVIGQLDVVTGAGNPAFAGYAVLATSTNSPGDSNTSDHVDLVFPALLTGVAVCPAPSTVGVATVFRFFGETLTQSAAGNGDVREMQDVNSQVNTDNSAFEHIIANPSTPVFDATGTCSYGPASTAGYACNGQ